MKTARRFWVAGMGLWPVVAWAQWQLEPAWSIAPGATLAEGVVLGAANSNTERGLAYNPATGNVLLVSRNSSTKVIVLDGQTGAFLKLLDVTGVTGGTFALSTIDVADDGAIFAANLVVPASEAAPFKVYRWAGEAESPTVAYAGVPADARYGDDLVVRGLGAATEILAGAGNSGTAQTTVARLETANGLAFTAQGIPVSGIANGDLRLGIAYGAGNTVYSKQAGALREMGYDPDAGTGVLLNSYTLATGGGTAGPLAVDPVRGLMVAYAFNGTANAPQSVNLYELAAFVPDGTVAFSDSELLPTANANLNGVGAVDFSSDGSMVFVAAPNNGVQAYRVVNLIPEPSTLSLLSLGALALLLRRRP